MASRFRAIIDRIKREPGWLLLLIGALTLYVTWRLYQAYAGGSSSSGASVPTNGIDTPLYPSSVGGTPGNPSSGDTTTGPGQISTNYEQQLQDLLNSLLGPGVVPSVPSFSGGSTGSSGAPGSSAAHPSTSNSSGTGTSILNSSYPLQLQAAAKQVLAAAQSVPQAIANLYAKSGGGTPPTFPAMRVGDNPAQWATAQPAPVNVVGDNPAQWATPQPAAHNQGENPAAWAIPTSINAIAQAAQSAISSPPAPHVPSVVPTPAPASQVARHQTNLLGY